MSDTLLSVGVIALNYEGSKYVNKCLESLLRSNYPRLEVIFVDNASKDSSLVQVRDLFERDPRLRVIANKVNYGYALANNLAAKLTDADLLVFLNVDTEVSRDWLQPIAQMMQSSPDIGALQCKLLADDKRTIDTCGHMLTNLGLTIEIGAGELDRGQFHRPFEIFSAKGAAFAIRRKSFIELGGFDPTFFLLREETDLCWRIWLRGYRVVFAPESVVYHLGGGSFKEVAKRSPWPPASLVLWYRNSLFTIIKNAELKNVIRLLIPQLSLSFGDSLIDLLVTRRPEKIYSFTVGILQAVARFKNVWFGRLQVQSFIRKRRDHELFNHIRVRISPQFKLSELRRIASGQGT